ncbi:MAG: phosphate ABC transporter permease PstA [Marmoricola sp.]
MTDVTIGSSDHIAIRHPRLPRFAPILVAVLAVAASTLIGLSIHFNIAGIVILAVLIYLVALPTWSLLIENRRSAVDRLFTTLVWCALAVALIPLISLVAMVVKNGAAQLTGSFFTSSMRNVIGQGGGIQHALVGTLMITAAAAVISVPIGIMAAVYLVEYGARSRAAAALRFLVDVMTGIPSIVAGLFAYALFALFFGAGVQMALGGAVALSLLMIPIVVRSTEEMLKLVPEHLREASYALGVPKWRTIVKVVLPTASSGIITGVTLAIARIIGETAPLLIIAGATASTNWDLFAPQTPTETLPVFIYSQYSSPGLFPKFATDRAWGAALVLIIVVLALNLLARVLGRIFAPSKSH